MPVWLLRTGAWARCARSSIRRRKPASVSLTCRGGGARHPGDLCHEFLGLALPADDQNPQAQAFTLPVRVQKHEQSRDVHGRHVVQIDHEVPVRGGDLVQGLLQCNVSLLPEVPVDADQERVSATLYLRSDHSGAPSCGAHRCRAPLAAHRGLPISTKGARHAACPELDSEATASRTRAAPKGFVRPGLGRYPLFASRGQWARGLASGAGPAGVSR